MISAVEQAKDPAKADIAMSILKIVQEMTQEDLGFNAKDIFKLLEQPKESKMGDFAIPCFRLAKPLQKKPPEVAQLLKTLLMQQQNSWIERIEVIGAFLNIFINRAELAKNVTTSILSGNMFEQLIQHSGKQKQNVMIEFSQPNTHKEFHVGHGRNVCLGDSLTRIFKYAGYKVMPVNYIGDEGTHIAKCLWQMKQCGEVPPTTNKAEWYGKQYVAATRKIEEATPEDRKVFEAEVSKILANIETKSGEDYEIWKASRQDCLNDFKKIYAWLDVDFDHYFYESEFGEISQKIVDEYKEKGLFVESDGAIGMNLEESKLGFCMVRKSDGNIPYITRDIALARKKFDEFKVDRSIYVVGSEQIYHFQQLFKTLENLGFEQAKKCFHLSYGMVVRPEGKMSSRKGNSVTFSELKTEMLKELSAYLEQYKSTWSEAEIEETAKRLSVGAIRYGMLQSDPNKEIVFNLKNWLAFEGDTGPYLMYSYARTQSILRGAKEQGHQASLKNVALLTHDLEAELLRGLYEFNNVVDQACEVYRPSNISHYLFSLCKSFNRFYAEVSVLKAESQELLEARLSLLEAFSKTLWQGLKLLGITPPERM